MKILIQSRVDLFERTGGDTYQILKTKEYLEKFGVNVDISTKLEPDLSKYNLVHLFNISPRVHDAYLQFLNIQKQKKPYVLSPIYHVSKEIDDYDKTHRYGILKLLNYIFPKLHTRETVKNIFRAIKDPRQRKAVWQQIKTGYLNQQREIVVNAKSCLVLTNLEAEQLKKDFGGSIICDLAPQGVENSLKAKLPIESLASPSASKLKDYVLCAGRIETLKNQLSTIKALADTDLNLVIVGDPNPLHKKYWQLVQKEIQKHKNIYYLSKVPFEQMSVLYQNAKVHVLASWYEVAPLVDLEAGLAGCNVVTTIKGYGKEYLKDYVWYCDPDDTDSIKQVVLDAYSAPRNDIFKQYILDNFSWEKTAKKTLEIYRRVLLSE